MDKTRKNKREHSQTQSLPAILPRTYKSRTSSSSSFSNIDEAVVDVTKQLELLESPSSSKSKATSPPTPRPTWKPKIGFSISEEKKKKVRAYTPEEPVKNIPYYERASKATDGRPGPRDFTSTLKTSGGSKLLSKSKKIPQRAFRAKEVSDDFATFSKSEPSSINPDSLEKVSNWLSKTGSNWERKPERRKALPLKRSITQESAQEDETKIKRPRKQQDPELSRRRERRRSFSSPINTVNEYEYDDVDGHSVDDNCCVSPIASPYVHDDNKTQGIGSYLGLGQEEEILLKSCLKEIKNVVDDKISEPVIIASIIRSKFNTEKALDECIKEITTISASASPYVKDDNKTHGTGSYLGQEEEILLKSCLKEIQNVVGDKISEPVIIASIIRSKFNTEKALDECLKKATTTSALEVIPWTSNPVTDLGTDTEHYGQRVNLDDSPEELDLEDDDCTIMVISD